jgi:hypothetical protein
VCTFYSKEQSKPYKTTCSFVIFTKISAAQRKAGKPKALSIRLLMSNSSFVCDCGFDRALYTATGCTLEGVPFQRFPHVFGCVGFSHTTQTLHLIYFLPLFCPFCLPSFTFLSFSRLFFLIFSVRFYAFFFIVFIYFLLSYEYYMYFRAKDRYLYFLLGVRININIHTQFHYPRLYFDFHTSR